MSRKPSYADQVVEVSREEALGLAELGATNVRCDWTPFFNSLETAARWAPAVCPQSGRMPGGLFYFILEGGSNDPAA